MTYREKIKGLNESLNTLIARCTKLREENKILRRRLRNARKVIREMKK
jgi:regulator of replication initiation timing